MSSYKIALILAILCFSIVAVQPAASAPPFILEGSLQINSMPSGATVYIDGEEMGVTPTTVTNLALGYHTVVLKKPGTRTGEPRRMCISGRQPLYPQFWSR